MRLIDADALDTKILQDGFAYALTKRNLRYTPGDVRQIIHNTPTVDAVQVVHGKWEPSEEHKGFVSCSVCHDCYVDPAWIDNLKWRYCPQCGTKLDL